MGVDHSDSGRVDRLRIHNSQPKTLEFTVEPWGDVHLMSPGQVFEIIARGPAEGFLELDASERGVIVFGWPGSVVNVFCEGQELGVGSSARPPVPPAPPGKSIREFVGWMKKMTGK